MANYSEGGDQCLRSGVGELWSKAEFYHDHQTDVDLHIFNFFNDSHKFQLAGIKGIKTVKQQPKVYMHLSF